MILDYDGCLQSSRCSPIITGCASAGTLDRSRKGERLPVSLGVEQDGVDSHRDPASSCHNDDLPGPDPPWPASLHPNARRSLPQHHLPDRLRPDRLGGASPDSIEQTIIVPVENTLSGLSGVQRIDATALQGSARITIYFVDGIDINQAAIDTQRQLSVIGRTLPIDASQPSVVKADPAAIPVLNVVLSGTDAARRSVRPGLEPSRAAARGGRRASRRPGLGRVPATDPGPGGLRQAERLRPVPGPDLERHPAREHRRPRAGTSTSTCRRSPCARAAWPRRPRTS